MLCLEKMVGLWHSVMMRRNIWPSIQWVIYVFDGQLEVFGKSNAGTKIRILFM